MAACTMARSRSVTSRPIELFRQRNMSTATATTQDKSPPTTAPRRSDHLATAAIATPTRDAGRQHREPAHRVQLDHPEPAGPAEPRARQRNGSRAVVPQPRCRRVGYEPASRWIHVLDRRTSGEPTPRQVSFGGLSGASGRAELWGVGPQPGRHYVRRYVAAIGFGGLSGDFRSLTFLGVGVDSDAMSTRTVGGLAASHGDSARRIRASSRRACARSVSAGWVASPTWCSTRSTGTTSAIPRSR